MNKFDVVVVGGGIAALELSDRDARIALVTGGNYVKRIKNIEILSSGLVEYDLEECLVQEAPFAKANDRNNKTGQKSNEAELKVFGERAIAINKENKIVRLASGNDLFYRKLVLCTGAVPRKVPSLTSPELVLSLRDTESALLLERKLQNSKKIAIFGDGGIALELVHNLKHVEIVWCSREKSFGQKFLDPVAMEFLLESAEQKNDEKKPKVETKNCSYHEYTVPNVIGAEVCQSAALGPSWYKHKGLKLAGTSNESERKITYHSGVELRDVVKTESNAAQVILANGNKFVVDFVVLAIGVQAQTELVDGILELSPADRGILVDSNMRSISDPCIYAAGDCCTTHNWPSDEIPNWFQMRLWTQAIQMGKYAARCLVSHLDEQEALLDFCFTTFTHCTSFFGFRTALLGLYNAQTLPQRQVEIIFRENGFENKTTPKRK
ncbi:Oidioi.mRNA.OKI2018_I69.chr1.g1656.t1.cds [Oikopleura dioica]|uniref:Oidioi.mRNA.OKI2018_I69.chr1.g1656.t1.cds n=1 Tax=Oikopleura dioica TaxID=34765 RepID=A0ABN7STM7_OIKDI|nr:Oidioi.mRNA.OKI2018_I69.chr1.g1656.t1.cds [Oikopleura dioica]